MVNISVLDIKMVKENSKRYDFNDKIIKSPLKAVKVINSVLDLKSKSEEHFVLMTLDTKKKLTGIFTISKGILDSSLVHPREVFKRAITNNAHSIIIFHNHPSGDPNPSDNDVFVTKKIKSAGEILGIDLIDHIIIADDKYCSLKESTSF